MNLLVLVAGLFPDRGAVLGMTFDQLMAAAQLQAAGSEAALQHLQEAVTRLMAMADVQIAGPSTG